MHEIDTPLFPVPAAGPGVGIRPSWVIVGAEQPGGVMLLASDTLSEAELKHEVRRVEIRRDEEPFRRETTDVTITLTLVMARFVMIHAVDYRSAFEALFKQWQPREGDRPAIGAAPW